MITASELAWLLRRGDTDEADIFLEVASEYLDIWRAAERRALYHAEQGDLFVAYDEACDARYGLAHGAVCLVAWLATIAAREDHARRMRLDCASTDGEQLALGETRARESR